MIKYLFSIILTITTGVIASPWMPWDSNANTNWMPFSADSNWGPISKVSNWMNDTNLNINFKTNNKIDTTNSVNVDAKYTGVSHNKFFGKGQGYSNAQTDAYYEGLANYYNNAEGGNSYYGYKGGGYFDYMPGMGNSFPAPVIDYK